MSKYIWYSKYETPKQESRVIWKSSNVVYGGRFDTYYKCFCGPASQFVDLKSVSCWAYIDDFLALETELERTRKALDVAVDALKDMNEIIKNYEYGNGLYYALDGHDTMLIAEDVEKALYQITALEQKDVK